MADWRLWDAKRRGTLVARILAQAWRQSPPAVDLSSEDLELITPILLDSPAAALAWNKLQNASLGSPLRDAFRDIYRFSALRSEMRAIDLTEVLVKMHSAGLDPVVHKGWATARLYPRPEMRSYSDIDLLVPMEHMPAAQAILDTLSPDACPIDFIHSEITELDALGWDTLYRRSRSAKLGLTQVRILGPEDHLRSLCIHGLKHGVASPLWLVDVAVAVESVHAGFDWELCIGERQPQANWVRCALSLAHHLLEADIGHTPIPEFADQLPGWLIRSVLRRWSRPPVPAALPRLASVLKRRTGVVEAFAWRWPSACQASVHARVTFTSLPNIHLQLQSILQPAKLKTFISDLPTVWREARNG